MSFWLSRGRLLLITASLAVAASGIRSANGQGEQTAAPSPKSSSVATNSSRLGGKFDGLKQLEKDLFKPLQGMNSEGSLDGVKAPQYRPPSPAQNSKMKEMRDRKKDWVFMDPNEMTAGPSVEEMLNLPTYGEDGKEKKKLSAFEKYYEGLNRKPGQANGSKGRSDDPLNPQHRSKSQFDRTSDEDSDLPLSFGQKDPSFKKFLEGDQRTNNSNSLPGSSGGGSILSDIFGLGKDGPSRQELEAQKARMDEFRQLLGMSPAPMTGTGTGLRDPLAGLPGTTRPSPTPTSKMEGFSSPQRPSSFEIQFGAIAPIPKAASVEDVNTKLFGPSSLSPTLPKNEAWKSAPPSPTFAAPKRVF